MPLGLRLGALSKCQRVGFCLGLLFLHFRTQLHLTLPLYLLSETGTVVAFDTDLGKEMGA